MEAVLIRSTGGPEVLEHADVPTPVPGPHDVLVRNAAIGVGMPDVMVRTGTYMWMPALPAIIGIEAAGVVEALGCEVRSLRVGQKVYVNARDLPERSGGYAQYRVAPADAVHPLAESVDLRKAAALGNYQVAESLLRMGGPAPVRTVAVLGAAGGVGSAALQLARNRGLDAIAVAGGAARCGALRGDGVETVDHTTEDIAQGILRLTSGRGADLVLDPAGGEVLPRLFAALAPLGTVVSYGGLAGSRSPSTVPAMVRKFGDSPALRLFSMHVWDAWPQMRREIFGTVLRELEAGRIDPVIDRCFPLAQARAAHRRFEARQHVGKILLLP